MIKNFKQIRRVMSIFVLLWLIFPVLIDIKTTQAAVHDVAVSTTVQSSLSMDITAGSTVEFGPLTPGLPIVAPNTGTVVSVETNANNGYTVGIHDNVAGTDSALLNTDAVTYIPDIASGTVAVPALWGVNTGLGITLFAADTNKELKWGTGAVYDSINNKYAAIPQNVTTAHTVTGEVVGVNTSSWGFKIDAAPSQKTGSYTGNITFTATAVLI